MPTMTIRDIFTYKEVSFNIPEHGAMLVTGKHSSGKTSMARVFAALTTHQFNPAGLSAAASKAYVREGAIEGFAEFDGVIWQPPNNNAVPNNKKPTASRHTVNMVNFMQQARSKNERAEVWEGLFLPEDPAAILEPRWTGDKKQLPTILEMISKHGWSAAASVYKEQSLQYRREWEKIAGERFKPASGNTWVPANWQTDLATASEDDLKLPRHKTLFAPCNRLSQSPKNTLTVRNMSGM